MYLRKKSFAQKEICMRCNSVAEAKNEATNFAAVASAALRPSFFASSSNIRKLVSTMQRDDDTLESDT